MNPNVILVFSAYAADFCSRAGGTLAKYVRKGDEVHVTDLTYGELLPIIEWKERDDDAF